MSDWSSKLTCQLQGGPWDGFEDGLSGPNPPDVLTVAFCQDCRRVHVHVVTVTAASDPATLPATYWLDVEHWNARGFEVLHAIYLHADPDEDLEDHLLAQRIPALTGAGLHL